jgi:hypothetical protein
MFSTLSFYPKIAEIVSIREHLVRHCLCKVIWYFIPELASGQVDPLLPELGAGPSSSASLSVEELEANLGVGELSRQSSHTSLSDPLSPSIHDFSDEESDISSDLEVN